MSDKIDQIRLKIFPLTGKHSKNGWNQSKSQDQSKKSMDLILNEFLPFSDL